MTDKLIAMTGGDYRPHLIELFTKNRENKWVGHGEYIIKSVAVRKYVADPTGGGNHQVLFNVCYDGRNRYITQNGKTVWTPANPDTIDARTETMQRQADGRWTLDFSEPGDHKC